MSYKTTEETRKYHREYRKNRRDKSPELREKERLAAENYRKANPYKARVSVHQSGVRKRNPEAAQASDFTDAELVTWLQDNVGKPCPYCGNPNYHIDHKVPLTRGGSHTWDNIELICPDCNVMKRDRTPDEYIAHVLRIAEYLKYRA